MGFKSLVQLGLSRYKFCMLCARVRIGTKHILVLENYPSPSFSIVFSIVESKEFCNKNSMYAKIVGNNSTGHFSSF